MANSIINNNQQGQTFAQQFQQFRNNFKGNPQQAVMQMLQSGQISQQQLQQVMAKAQQLLR